MTVEEIAQSVFQSLEEHGIAYMVVGSLASNIHGVPRSTHDADIVIECDKPSLERFIESLQNDFYADKAMAIDALQTRFMFNIIHYQEGIKIDFIIKKLREFDIEEFNRRTLVPFSGQRRWVATPEDTILAKLEWYKKGGSERQLDDAVNIARLQGNKLDKGYLLKWSMELDVLNFLQMIFEHLDSKTQ